MRIWYVYKVTEDGKWIRDFKTRDRYAIENTVFYSRLNHAMDKTCRIAIVAYQNGEKVAEWKNFQE